MAALTKTCAWSGCDKTSTEYKYCGRCRNVKYCDPICQKQDWPNHKQHCIDTKQSSKMKAVLAKSKPVLPLRGVPGGLVQVDNEGDIVMPMSYIARTLVINPYTMDVSKYRDITDALATEILTKQGITRYGLPPSDLHLVYIPDLKVYSCLGTIPMKLHEQLLNTGDVSSVENDLLHKVVVAAFHLLKQGIIATSIGFYV